MLAQRVNHVGDGGGLLTDGDVYAHHVLVALIKYGIDCDGGLTSLAVADYQFALAAANRYHGVDGQYARHKGLCDLLAVMYGRTGRFYGALFDALGGLHAVQRAAQRIDHAAQQRLAHGHAHYVARGLCYRVLLDCHVAGQKHGVHIVFGYVHRDRGGVADVYQLAISAMGHTGYRHNAIGKARNLTHVGLIGIAGIILGGLALTFAAAHIAQYRLKAAVDDVVIDHRDEAADYRLIDDHAYFKRMTCIPFKRSLNIS